MVWRRMRRTPWLRATALAIIAVAAAATGFLFYDLQPGSRLSWPSRYGPPVAGVQGSR